MRRQGKKKKYIDNKAIEVVSRRTARARIQWSTAPASQKKKKKPHCDGKKKSIAIQYRDDDKKKTRKASISRARLLYSIAREKL